MSATITIRLNEEEQKIFNEYAKVYKGGLSTMIKQLALERLQEEYDLAAIERYERGIADGSVTTRPYSELLKEVGLD